MKRPTLTDIILNVLLPLLLGAIPYSLGGRVDIPTFISSHLSDACWAYAFASCLLIVWSRRLHAGWMIAAVLVSIDFEALQYYHFIAGTGDLWDVVTYAAATVIAIALNQYFKRTFITDAYKTKSYAYEF